MRVDAEGFAGGDRTLIDLPAPQEKLLERVQALGKPTVMVLMNGSAVAINWADANVPAILEAWYPGEEGGNAVAQAIAGDFSPGGPLAGYVLQISRSASSFRRLFDGQAYLPLFDGEPLYPFGYGLSYTSFTYGRVHADHEKISATEAVTLSVDVTNSGAAAGDEVVQLYLSHPGVAGAPVRALKGFTRIHLDRGEKKTVKFVLRDRDLGIVDLEGKHRIVPGNVGVWIGGGQPVSRTGLAKPAGVESQFTITSEALLPD